MNEKITSYLDHIKFDSKLNNKFIFKYLNNLRLVILLVVVVILSGVASYATLPRRLNPEVQIPIVVVSTVFPGAGPEDVETLISIPLEEEISGIDGLETLSSNSIENVSLLTLEFESDINGKEAEREVQSLVDKVSLPNDATTPQVKLVDFEDQALWRFALFTETNDVSLINFAKELEESIEDLSSVDRVEVQGLENEEIKILVDHQKILDFGISPITLSNEIRDKLDSLPAGNIIVNKTNFPLSIDAPIENIQDIRDLQLSYEKQQIKLSEVATITFASELETPKAYIAKDGDISRVVVFSIYKNLNADIVLTSEEAKALVEKELGKKQGTFEILTFEDSAKDIDDQFNELVSNFASTIALVFITLLLFLGIRQALIVSISIPITFLTAFIAMSLFGLSINFLTLFSLLLALGLLVDDAIVIVSAMTSYYKTGKFTASETGSLVWRDFIIPIWSTTLTTVWAFLPLLLSSGIIGEFIKSIPIVVSATLVASTSVAVLIILPIMIFLLEPKIASRIKKFLVLSLILIIFVGIIFSVAQTPALLPTLVVFLLLLIVSYKTRIQLSESIKGKIKGTNKINKVKKILGKFENGIINTEHIVAKYQRLIERIITDNANRRRTIIMVVIFSLFSYFLVPLGFVKNEFFPSSDFDLIYINLEYPQGTDLETTQHNALEVLELLKNEEYVEYISMETSRNIDVDNLGGNNGSENLATFTLSLIDENSRPSSVKIANDLRKKYENYNKGDLSVVELAGGPPAGADLQIKLLGDDLGELDSYAKRTIEFLESQEGTNNVRKSITPGASKLSIEINEIEANRLGVSNQNLGAWLRTYVSGFDLDEITIDQTEYDIIMRISNEELSPKELSKIQIPTQKGNVLFDQVANLKLDVNPTAITRENGQRTISVAAAVSDGYNIPELNQKLEEFAENDLALAPGYSWQTGGVNEENQKSIQSILLAMGLSAILILVTMVLQLGSFRKALIVLLVIPLAVSGVFIMFAITGTPLSFPALIGILALFGIVVNNSIVVVEKINQNLLIGMQIKEAVTDASSRRLEPILFSSLTTIMGLIPITLSDPLWRGLGGAIIYGLMFSGGIMLLFIPAVFYSIYKEE